MFCAPAVVCEISAPPITPRGTSRSGPGLTTLMRPAPASWVEFMRCDLDLQRRLWCRLVVDLQRCVLHAKALLKQPLQSSAELVAVVAGAHDNVRGQRRKAGGD